MTRARAAATAAAAAAFIALLAVVGTVTFVAVREEPAPPTTTTTSRPPTSDEVANATAVALSEELDVPLTDTEATCVASGVVKRLGLKRLEEMAAAAGAGVDELTGGERDGLVRAIVLCVPPDKAAALLNTKPPAPTGEDLPGEGAVP